MKANPGGQIDPADVVGREALIHRFWRVLTRQSLVLSAERRMGKTTIIRKMRAEVQDARAFYRDLEEVRTPIEFVETVLEDVRGCLSLKKRGLQATRKLLEGLGGAEAMGFKLPEMVKTHWKRLLEAAIKDLVEGQEQKVVFFWDELPLMLDNIRKSSGDQAAMEVLDTLRALRQNYGERLRMVYTGSIGLHSVITALKRSGYANDPTNDMQREDVPHLGSIDAQSLALKLIQGEALEIQDADALAKVIATAVDGMPFYIHHVVDRLTQKSGPIDQTVVDQVVSFFLKDPQDTLHLRYYRERINTYYTDQEKPIVLVLLDVLSAGDIAMNFSYIYNRVLAKFASSSGFEEQVREVLTLLQLDHYIEKTEAGEYKFRSSFIQKYWRFERGV